MLPILFFLAASTPPPRAVVKKSSPLTPCEVVTNFEVQQAFKRPFAKGSEDGSSCEFTALEQQVVAVKMQHSIAKIDVQAEMLTLRKAFPDARLRDAKGFASTAFFLDHPQQEMRAGRMGF